MTTENVAIMFTDIVGSTELSQRLSAESVDEVRRIHFSILRRAVTEAGGAEVKTTGDGLMVVFGSASAALGCAVAMQQGVERNNRGSEHSVGLRIGLSIGEVSREDGDYFGDPAVEAARLCALCEGGQVLATKVLRAIAGRRSRFECRSIGQLELKGLSDPVETVGVLWEPLDASIDAGTIPLPGHLAIRPDMGVVGRVAEAESIADAHKRVASGGGREVVLVSGEAGLGKTTLVAEASRVAHEAGTMILFGHCEEELATPYQLFAEALGHYVTHAPEDQLLAHVAAHGSELTRVLPALASRIPDLPPTRATDADTERFLLFAAIVGLLATMSEHQPIVLVLDDLQWADKGSLLLLRHLAGSDAPMRLLVLGIYRDSELSNAHALVETLASLRRLGGMSRIELVGLDDDGVMALMEAAAGHDLEDDAVGLAHAIYRETDGNPFFVSEVLRNLVETGAIAQNAEGRWEANAALDVRALPDSVREVIGARVVRLGKEAGRILSVAAVIGRDFDLDLLAVATNSSEDDVLDALDAAAAVSLARELADAPGRYSFAHALIQHTLYEDLGPTRRAQAHRWVAEALEDICQGRPGARVGELARHWFSTTQPRDLTRALDYARLAGDRALQQLAPDEASRWYSDALEMLRRQDPTDDPLRAVLLVSLGDAQRQSGDAAHRETLLEAAHLARAADDTGTLVRAALANNRGIVSSVGTVDQAKVEVLEMALSKLSAISPDRALLLATLCLELAYSAPLERRQALADEALSVARSCADDATIVSVLNKLPMALAVPSFDERVFDWTAEAFARAERLDECALFWAASQRHAAVVCAGDISEADRCLETAGHCSRRLGQPMLDWNHIVHLSARACLAGDADLAEQLANEALQIGIESGQPDAAIYYGAQILQVAALRGTMGDLVPLIEQAAKDNPGLPVFVAALAFAHTEADHFDDARALLVSFASAEFSLPMDTAWLGAMLLYAATAAECRDPTAAESLFDQLAPSANLWCYDGCKSEGPVSLCLGSLATVLARHEEADAFFSHSAELCERMGTKFYAARTDLLWGTMLADRQSPGDRVRAKDLLTKAHGVATVHGYGTVERRAALALRGLL